MLKHKYLALTFLLTDYLFTFASPLQEAPGIMLNT